MLWEAWLRYGMEKAMSEYNTRGLKMHLFAAGAAVLATYLFWPLLRKLKPGSVMKAAPLIEEGAKALAAWYFAVPIFPPPLLLRPSRGPLGSGQKEARPCPGSSAYPHEFRAGSILGFQVGAESLPSVQQSPFTFLELFHLFNAREKRNLVHGTFRFTTHNPRAA